MEQALISRLQVRQLPGQKGRLDGLTARLRMGSLLEQLDLSRVGLGPSAVLCIRRLEDPLPGRLSLQNGALSTAWENALLRGLEEQARRAARPAREMVPAGANAVLFTDQAELLACLAADWCRGEWAQRWWWQTWLGAGDAREAVLAAWKSSPAYIPGAFLHLDRLHRTWAGPISAENFVDRVGPAAARALLEAVLRVFGLPELLRVFSTNPVVRSPSYADGPAVPQQPGQDMEEADRPRPEPPWHPFIQAGTDVSANPRQDRPDDLACQALVGTSLALAENPARVRTPAFAEQAGAWWAWSNGYAGPAASRVHKEETSADPPPGLSNGFAAGPVFGEPAAEITGPMARAEGPAWEITPGARDEMLEEMLPAGAAQNTVALQPDLDAVLQTELGGLFYLVNLSLYLGLYADFTGPDLPGLDLNIWDFVSLLGEGLLGQAMESTAAFRADPIWGVLARLAGRGVSDPPGVGFAPPDAWRIPPGWLSALAPAAARFAGRPWRWSSPAGRLRVEHPLGFAVLDLPLEGHSPAQVLDRERRNTSAGWGTNEFRLWKARPRKGQADGALYADLPAALARWLGWVTGYVRARLALALGPDLSERPSGAAYRLLAAPARLRVTTTHVEVHLSLDRLPVEIRLAGLDRDPGWVPAAGRFIRFLYA